MKTIKLYKAGGIVVNAVNQEVLCIRKTAEYFPCVNDGSKFLLTISPKRFKGGRVHRFERYYKTVFHIGSGVVYPGLADLLVDFVPVGMGKIEPTKIWIKLELDTSTES